ncbi:hypothetical protein [Streptomyces sp. NPDC096323]|uniref:COG4315 family predicted lipoprotein n=1 Tax=Streptomyces sp. NPDC096323 TaxID=3155822 RepID=UPI003330C510
MKRTSMAAICAATALLTATLSSCSDSSGDSSADGYGSTTSTKVEQAIVKTKTAGKLGTILVDDKGRTLYLFLADKKNQSKCTGDCAEAWPPLMSKGTAEAGKGVDEKLLGLTKRSGSAEQVTYNGHPLYYYAGDTDPGQTNGQGLDQFGAAWYVLDAKGKQVVN